jgi:hypothetical protein
MKTTGKLLWRFAPSPCACFVTSILLLLLGAGLATTFTVVRKQLDAHGHVILGPNGRPLVEVDQWATFWNGWYSNIPGILSVAFLGLGVFLLLLGRPYKKQRPT